VKSEIEVPEGWKFIKQSKVTDFYNGRAYKLAEWEKTGTPVIRLQNLTGTGKDYYYSNLQLPESQYVKDGDLLYMWSASFGPYIWKGPKAIYHYHIWKVECSDDINKKFMYYHLANITQLLKRKMHGMAILHITKSRMEKEKILLPPFEEQQKIADILSKVDEQIDLTEKIIDKTEELKKGLMQKLLTKGIEHTKFKNTEFGEIPEEWEIGKLSDNVEINMGQSPNSASYNYEKNGMAFFQGNSDFGDLYPTVKQYTTSPTKVATIGEVLLSVRAPVGEVNLCKEQCCIGRGLCSIKGECSNFIFYLLKFHKKDLKKLSTGSTFTAVNKNSFDLLKVRFPSKDEQKQIATILSKVDEHIQDNKKELTHLKEVKKGLMQDLLTGKVRVSV